MKKYRFLIAGGGTGGHLFPGLAFAKYIKKEYPKSEILFIGTEKGIEYTEVPKNGFNLKCIDISGIKGKGIKDKLSSLFKIPSSVNHSLKILHDFQPDAVIGLGGYASGPLLLASWLGNYPAFIMEQNSVPGITNRLLSRVVYKIFTTFNYSHNYFPSGKSIKTGNPVREEILSVKRKIHQNDKFSVLVFGGSLGAKKINEVMIDVVKKLPNIYFTHQTGKLTYDIAKESYKTKKIDNVNLLTFIDNMAEAYQNADLVICRAGATSISELQVAKKASILIPFPFATDNHQVLNGKEMEESGASIMIEEKNLTSDLLIEKILYLQNNIYKLEEMEEKASSLGIENSAQRILEEISRYLSDK
ncbi:undecaprenyldiphospho-muramoylpentapeptide beta-N-acetylglucosaminyltransferase [bacterium]|nr:undecaprenyldiphospho-muramoylpentapeptide beta-N-acetylglucosaminyltransferase [bacterium]